MLWRLILELKIEPLVWYFMVLTFPLLGLLANAFIFNQKFQRGAQTATFGIWMGFITAVICWVLGVPFNEKPGQMGFHPNELSWLMSTFILFMSGIIHHFCLRYMIGDKKYRQYFLILNSVTVSVVLLMAVDNILLFAFLWMVSNLFLLALMVHKFEWAAARNSGLLALKTFTGGFISLLVGCWLLSEKLGTFSIHAMNCSQEAFWEPQVILAILLMILAGLIQSGVWPFHNWLISSLNSPTPVSAMMHAGLVNGGGVLLARFAPLYASNHLILNSLFLVGVLTLFLGTIWKLMQNDVKRMLACSTMGQMGFMIMQCGLGLFPAAVAHLLWHGFFKAFLFLRAGSVIQDSRSKNESQGNQVTTFVLAILCGISGAYGFARACQITFNFETPFVLVVFACIGTAQLAHSLLKKRMTIFLFVLANLLSFTSGSIYGLSVYWIEELVSGAAIFRPYPLNLLHVLATICIVLVWAAFNLRNFFNYEASLLWRQFYVRMLNASQPNPETINSMRQGYKF